IFSYQVAAAIFHDNSIGLLIMIAMLTYLPSQTAVSCFFGAFQGTHRMKYVALTDLIFQVSRISIEVLMVLIRVGTLSLIFAFSIGSAISLIAAYFLFIRKLFKGSAEESEPARLSGVASFSGFNYLATGLTTLAAQLSYILLGGQDFASVALFGVTYLI